LIKRNCAGEAGTVNRKRDNFEESGEYKRCPKARRVEPDPAGHIRNGELIDMCTLEAMEIEILKHLYEKRMSDINEGWEKQSKLDKNAVEELCRAKLVDKSVSKGFVRLSERGVGAVLFGLQNADKIYDLL
jgi:hypothetical protein